MSKPESSMVKSDESYIERADAANKQARAAEIPLIIKAYETAKTGAKEIAKGAVLSVNALREIGIRLKACCGHEKLSFVFWKTQLEKQLPFDYEFAKFCIATANKMDRKAENLGDVIDTLQMVFVQFGFIDPPRREGSQNAIANKLQSLCCKIVEMKKPFQQILNSYKMEDWTRDDLELWLAESEWILRERARAEQFLKALK